MKIHLLVLLGINLQLASCDRAKFNAAQNSSSKSEDANGDVGGDKDKDKDKSDRDDGENGEQKEINSDDVARSPSNSNAADKDAANKDGSGNSRDEGAISETDFFSSRCPKGFPSLEAFKASVKERGWDASCRQLHFELGSCRSGSGCCIRKTDEPIFSLGLNPDLRCEESE